MSRTRHLLTKYGYREVEAVSLHGSAVLYTLVDHVVPAGTRHGADRALKKPDRWRRGTIMMPRLLKPEGSDRTFIWSAFPYGIYEALRSVMHTRHGYAGWDDDAGVEVERGELPMLEDVNQALFDALVMLALRPNLSANERDALRLLVNQQITRVGNVRDENKRHALERMLRAQQERDSRDRNNPSARMATLVGAQGDFEDRLGLIRYIEPRIGSREMALLLEAARIKRIFGAAYKAVEAARQGYFLRNRDQCVTSIGSVRRDLETISVGPYPVHIERLSADLCEAEDATRHFTTAVGKERLGIVMESLRCKRARWVLEELLVRMALFGRQCKKKPSKEVSAERKARYIEATAEQFAGEIAMRRERVASRINDTGFKKPVRQLVCDDLVEAETRLTKVRPLDVRGAKACVQRAARRL